MSGFGIIIINREDKAQYNNEKGIDTEDLDSELYCFDTATSLYFGIAAAAASVLGLML